MKTDVAVVGAGALGRTRYHVLVLAGAEQQKRWSHPIHGVLACEETDCNEFVKESQQKIM
jgi:hypothetical protein